MNYILLVLFVSFSFLGLSQETISGTILSKDSREALPYAHIRLKNTNRGAITNEDGFFFLKCASTDTLIITFWAHKKTYVQADYFLKKKVFLLKERVTEYQSVTVHGNNEFLYDLVPEAAKVMSKGETFEGKTYFSLETNNQNRPVELLECYYNGKVSPQGLQKLDLKNGRVGTSLLHDTYFVSLNTTEIFSQYKLLSDEWSRFLYNPLQLNKRRLKKTYHLALKSFDSRIYQVQCTPKESNPNYFKSTLWIDKETKRCLRIELHQENAQRHPLRPIHSTHVLDSLNFRTIYSFAEEAPYQLDKIEFDYQLYYDDQIKQRRINSSGVFLFYAPNEIFQLPLNGGEQEKVNDYQTIVSQPHNAAFWEHNAVISPSKKSKEYQAFFEKYGVLLNFNELSKYTDLLKNNTRNWSEKRLLLEHINGFSHPTYEYLDPTKPNVSKASINAEKYEFAVHIYLDRNEFDGKTHYVANTWIDTDKTFYFLRRNRYTDCFLNIYFDLAEIQKRQLLDRLNSGTYSAKEVETLYREALKSLYATYKEYITKTQYGEEYDAMEKYIQHVKGELGIDNEILVISRENFELMKKLGQTKEGKRLALYNYGSALLTQGQYQQGLDLLMEAYNEGDKHPWLYYNIGYAYYKLGKSEEACPFVQQAYILGEQVSDELMNHCGLENTMKE